MPIPLVFLELAAFLVLRHTGVPGVISVMFTTPSPLYWQLGYLLEIRVCTCRWNPMYLYCKRSRGMLAIQMKAGSSIRNGVKNKGP